MVKMSDESIDYAGNLKRVVKGSLVSMGITLVLLFVLSMLLTYTSLAETVIPMVVLVITGISILVGSQISTVHIRKNGIINGAVIGLIYILTLYLISSIISGNFTLNFLSIIMIVISLVTGALGGIIGVNRK